MLAGQHSPVDNTTLGLLFAADRADHVQREVEPALANGTMVISDRWYHSSLAYQGEGEARAWVRELNRHAPAPDLTLFVDVSPEEAARRRAGRDEDPEIFDALDTQRRVARGYHEVVAQLRASGERIEILDGSQSPAEVLDRALAALDEL
jgi:dTMP kinase